MTTSLDYNIHKLIANYNNYIIPEQCSKHKDTAEVTNNKYIAMLIDDDDLFDISRQHCWDMYREYMLHSYNNITRRQRFKLPFIVPKTSATMFKACISYMNILDRLAHNTNDIIAKDFYYRLNPHRLSNTTMCYICDTNSAVLCPRWLPKSNEYMGRICVLCFNYIIELNCT